MKKCILIITSSIDCTVDSIIHRYETEVNFFRIDVDDFANYKISVGQNNKIWEIIDLKNKTSICKDNIWSIYYRKPILPDLSEYESSYHMMIQKDIMGLLNGIVDSFDGIVVSKPSLLRLAENKTNQLIYAIKHKWKIPNSFIGNNSDKQIDFSLQKSIIKPLTTGKVYTENGCELYQTSYFECKKEDISLTPIYLQNYIQKQFEVRITVINNTFYTIRIDTMDKLDWRSDYENHEYTLIECPDDIKSNCLSMLENYHLNFGTFDYIVTPENEWIFLELNPNGQWLWLEEALNLDMSEKLITYLQGEHK